MNFKICETIKTLRVSRGISQENFANALGISAQAVSKWENRKALPDISLLPGIASEDWGGTHLPSRGVFMASEESPTQVKNPAEMLDFFREVDILFST